MTGTPSGGLNARETNLKRQGSDYYKRIGALGGKASNTGGFASTYKCDGSCDLDNIFGLDHRKAQCAGYKGGKKHLGWRKHDEPS